MTITDMTREDSALFEQIIQRSGFERVHTWHESHGLQVDTIYQRPLRIRTSAFPSAGEEIVMTRRSDGFGGPVSLSFRTTATPAHDYLLATAVLREAEAHPDEWIQRVRNIEPCCTASSTRYERVGDRDREIYCVVRVAGHGTWAYRDKEAE